MACCPNNCKKYKECANFFENTEEYKKHGIVSVGPFDSYGSFHDFIDKNGKHHSECEFWCGENGHYAMFKEV